MSEIEASVIIPAFNEKGRIESQLEALARQKTSLPWEVIVADNGSTDRTDEVVEKYQGKIPILRLVRAAEIQGAGHARNVGARYARGLLLLFCDADDIVTDGWLEKLVNGLKSYDAVGGPTDAEPLNTEEAQLLRNPPVSDHLHVVFGFPRAVTANCGVRASVFEKLGGFDPTYLDSQDTEFFIRLQVNGFSLGFVPDAVVLYRHAEDLKTTLKKIYQWQKTRPRLYREYRKYGEQEQPLRGILGWGVLFFTSWHLLAGTKRRLKWLRAAAHSYGRLIGSIKHRTLYL